jgi:K(+)-stimulated pyrophosphate-energized sodium pump
MQALISFLEQLFPFMTQVTPFEAQALWTVLIVALLAASYALVLRALVLRQARGPEAMQTIGDALLSGASAYIKTQARVIAVAAVVLAALLAASGWFFGPGEAARERFGGDAQLWIAGGRAVSCLLGALFATVAALVGLNIGAAGSLRAAAGASKGYRMALRVAYSSGTITGLLTVGLGLAGSVLILMFAGSAAPDLLIGFAAGGSLAALFLRVGGGIANRAAALGGSIASQGEDALPPTDTRNPAPVASMVGTGASGSAGAVADAFESLEVATLAALVLGFALGDAMNGTVGDGLYDLRFVILPLLLRGIGIVAAIIGNAFVRTDDKHRNARAAVSRGFFSTALLAILGFAVLSYFYMAPPLETPSVQAVDWRPFFAASAGVVLAVVLDRLTRFFTATNASAVKAIGRNSQNGVSGTVMSGMATGFDSGVWATVATTGAVLISLLIYADTPPDTQVPAVLYGIALIGMGMLTLAGNTLATSSFGAVAEGARGIGQLAGQEKNPRNVVEDLDVVGDTTRAAIRGIATGAAVIAVTALAGALLLGGVQAQRNLLPDIGITITSVVFVALLIGSALPLLFSSQVLHAVTRAAVQMVNELRRQWSHTPIIERSVPPDYARAVDAAASSAWQDALVTGLIAVLVPALIGLLLGVEALVGLLVGALLASQALAVFQANAGSAWESAKTAIEDGFYGGRNSDAHRAALVGDTLGSPLRDATGPALGPLLKLVGLAALVLAPLVVALRPTGQFPGVALLVTLGVLFVVLLAAIWYGGRSTPESTRPKKAQPARKRSTKTRA